MEKSLFEQMGGTYTQVGDYLLPRPDTSLRRTETYRHFGTATRTTLKAKPQNSVYELIDKW